MRLAALFRSTRQAFLAEGLLSAIRVDALVEAGRLDDEALFVRLESSPEGLEAAEAEARLAREGFNRIAQNGRPSVLAELWERAKNPLNALLLGLAAASWFLGDANAALIISIIVALAIVMAFVQEHRSSDAAAKLREIVKTTSCVKRRGSAEGVAAASGGFLEIPMERVVPGDIVRLAAGDMIPADMRLLQAKDLFVNQSSLSGEALPVEKSAERDLSVEVSPLDARNLCLMGASVVSGFATGVVVETGARTFLGQLAHRLGGRREPTSFERGVNRFIRMMLAFMLALAPAVFLVNGLMKGDWPEALLFALAVAVGLTPELLPMIVTVNLAKGAIAMAKKRVIVKRLNAIQNFGAMDVLCTDKTGTLTQNRVSLSLHLDVDGQSDMRVLEFAYLNARLQSGLESLLDRAVIEHVGVERGDELGRRYRIVDEAPFDFVRKRLSVVLAREHGEASSGFHPFVRLAQLIAGAPSLGHLLVCKGAVEETLACCAHVERRGRVSKLSECARADALARTHALNEDGLRVVAVAYKEIRRPRKTYSAADERDLVLLGFLAFLDPPKETTREALAALGRSGVAIKILTGDNEIVTRKICREVGLPAERIALGAEIEKLPDAELTALAEETTIFAKLSPDQKARIVSALHARGHVVGFLGDGINDSLALKTADIGVSVEAAVDIAKESADIILLEKSLLVLHEGVVEGRKVFGNIVKYIKMGASSNFGSMFSVIGASMFVPFLPMLPMQVLALNLLYDFSQTAIPTDDVDAEFLARPRRWDIGVLFKFMIFIGPISSIFDYATFYFMTHWLDGLQNPALFQTGWFVESLLTQTLIIHVIRTARTPFVDSRASLPLIATSLIVCAVGALLPYTPAGEHLKLTPLPQAYWPFLAATLVAYAGLTQLVKRWFVRRWGS